MGIVLIFFRYAGLVAFVSNNHKMGSRHTTYVTNSTKAQERLCYEVFRLGKGAQEGWPFVITLRSVRAAQRSFCPLFWPPQVGTT